MRKYCNYRKYRYLYIVLLVALFSCQNTEDKQLVSYQNADNISIDSTIGEDSVTRLLIQPYKDSLDKSMNQVIGRSEQLMVKGFPEGLLGNFICDLMLESAVAYTSQVDFAMTNNGGLRNILPKGDIYLRNVYEVMPFDNSVVVLEMNAAKMQALFDYIASEGGLSISGMRLEIDGEEVKKATIGGEDFEKGKSYYMVTNDYLANGGDHMTFLKDIDKRENLNVLLRDMIAGYIKAQSEKGNIVKSKQGGRIKIAN